MPLYTRTHENLREQYLPTVHRCSERKTVMAPSIKTKYTQYSQQEIWHQVHVPATALTFPRLTYERAMYNICLWLPWECVKSVNASQPQTPCIPTSPHVFLPRVGVTWAALCSIDQAADSSIGELAVHSPPQHTFNSRQGIEIETVCCTEPSMV